MNWKSICAWVKNWKTEIFVQRLHSKPRTYKLKFIQFFILYPILRCTSISSDSLVRQSDIQTVRLSLPKFSCFSDISSVLDNSSISDNSNISDNIESPGPTSWNSFLFILYPIFRCTCISSDSLVGQSDIQTVRFSFPKLSSFSDISRKKECKVWKNRNWLEYWGRPANNGVSRYPSNQKLFKVAENFEQIYPTLSKLQKFS